MQLDIFDHSRDVMLRNDVLDALQRRDAVAARRAIETLGGAYPNDSTLAPVTTLIDALMADEPIAFADPAAVQEATLVLNRSRPAGCRKPVRRCCRRRLARTPLWRQTAERAAALPFSAEHSDAHVRCLLAACRRSAGRGRSRCRHRVVAPHPGAARLDGRGALLGRWGRVPHGRCWPSLAWLSPRRCDTLLRRLADPSIEKLRKRFDASFEGDGDVTDLAWFPAWLLTDTPALARWLELAQPSCCEPPEQAMRLLLELIGLERQGRHADLVQRRRSLRDLHAGLYASYMQTR